LDDLKWKLTGEKKRTEGFWIKRIDIELEDFMKQAESTWSCKAQHDLIVSNMTTSSFRISNPTHLFKDVTTDFFVTNFCQFCKKEYSSQLVLTKSREQSLFSSFKGHQIV
jgi:hypothetical protein